MLTDEQIKTIKPQDRFKLNYRGKTYQYIAMDTPKGIVLVHEGKTPVALSMGALPIAKAIKFNFFKTEE